MAEEKEQNAASSQAENLQFTAQIEASKKNVLEGVTPQEQEQKHQSSGTDTKTFIESPIEGFQNYPDLSNLEQVIERTVSSLTEKIISTLGGDSAAKLAELEKENQQLKATIEDLKSKLGPTTQELDQGSQGRVKLELASQTESDSHLRELKTAIKSTLKNWPSLKSDLAKLHKISQLHNWDRLAVEGKGLVRLMNKKCPEAKEELISILKILKQVA